MQAYTVSGSPCLSVLVHVHVYISVILIIHGSHYNPDCQSHIMPVAKTLTSDHPWLFMDRQYESNPRQSIHACHCMIKAGEKIKQVYPELYICTYPGIICSFSISFPTHEFIQMLGIW